MPFIYSPPDEGLIDAAVTGTPDVDFQALWLTNGQICDPVKTTGDFDFDIAPVAPVSVGIIAALNHTIVAGNSVDVSGDITATLTVPTWRRNGMARNVYAIVDPVESVSNLSVAVTGNGIPVVISEFWAGATRTLERQLLVDPEFNPAESFEWEGPMGPNDDGTELRRLAGNTIMSGSGLADIHGWYDSTNRGSKASLILPVYSVGVAPEGTEDEPWLSRFQYTWSPHLIHKTIPARSLFRVHFEFVECERSRQ
jgi:hypothetical protein